MEPWIMVVTVVFSVLIPLFLFMFSMRPFIHDTVKTWVNEISGDIRPELASLKGEITAYRETQKLWIDLYERISKPGNPHPNKEILLEKLKNDTITRDEAIALQEIMTSERNLAEQDNNLLKAVIIIGILALVASAINRQQEVQRY